METSTSQLYADLGVRPVINAAGAYTVLGGSTLSPGVRAAMEEANRSFADMKELLARSCEVVAGLLEAEAAYVTSGAAAALVLATAACLTRDHPEAFERLPDTSAIPAEVLTHSCTRQKYDRCLELAGARLVEFGNSSGATIDDLRAAIGPATAAVHSLVPPHPVPGLLPVEAVIEAAHARGVPVIVDAAGHTYPLDSMRRYTRLGADLVCYAGKYFDAPHSTGLVTGRRQLVDLVATNSFVGFETSGYYTLGRPLKVDRQEIVGLVVALREWLAMNHEERLLRYAARCDFLLDELRSVPGIEAFHVAERETPLPQFRDGVRILLDGAGKRAEEVFGRLRDGEPSVWVRIADEVANAINVSVAFFRDEDLEVVARRLQQALS